jgi:hypothetical protein
MSYRDRITIEPGKRSGKPCIRGMRVTVFDVLGRRVLHREAHVPEGEAALALSTDALPDGLYVWRVTAGAQIRTGTFTRVR